MFCPQCGKAEQTPDSYCRQCGLLLPDLSRIAKRETPPEEHLKANTVLSSMTIATSLTLSILLFSFFGGPGTHPLIYVTAGLLLGISAWHIQSLIRTQLLKKQWKRRTPITEAQPQASLRAAPTTAGLLDGKERVEKLPASVTEHTTRQLVEK